MRSDALASAIGVRASLPLRRAKRSGMPPAPSPHPASSPPESARPDRKTAEQEVRVGHRGLGAPAPVARRPRHRAGAPRPHPERAVRLHPHDGTAARADGVDVELRHLQRVGVDLVVVRHAGREPVHQGDVGARSAHVERDDVFDPRGFRDPDRTGDPTHRPGEECSGAALGRRGEGHRAPVRAHDVDRRRDVAIEQGLLQRRQIGPHHRREVCVENRSRCALELAALRRQGGGSADGDAVEPAAELPRDRALVRVVDVAVEQRHRDRLHVLVAQCCGQRIEIEAVQRPHHRAVRRDALGHLQPAVPGNERSGPSPLGVEQPSDQAASLADLEQIAKAFGSHQTGRRTLALQQRIGRDRRPVHERLDRCRLHPERGEGIEDASPLLARQRRHLGRMQGAVRAVGNEVGECSADIYTDTVRSS